ncbi:MAG: hypothetical protein WAM92_06715 [Mycobacterium sp.]
MAGYPLRLRVRVPRYRCPTAECTSSHVKRTR